MHGSALRGVRSDQLSLCNRLIENWKYKTVKYIEKKDFEKPFGIYHYVAESSCCAKFYRNLITHFGWSNRGSLRFFYLQTHTPRVEKMVFKVLVFFWFLKTKNLERSDFFVFMVFQILFFCMNYALKPYTTVRPIISLL